MRIVFLLSILVLMVLGSCYTPTVIQDTASSEDIRNLKQGYLLVRLRNVDRQVALLRQRRQRTQANRIRVQQKLTNARIVEAFRDHFDFCPVYFFYSNNSRNVIERSLDSLVLDHQMLPVDSGLLTDKKFLAAEFADIQPPADGAGLPALIVMNDELRQLADPFPYYVRTTVLGKEDMEDNAVRLLNEKLTAFYEQSVGQGK